MNEVTNISSGAARWIQIPESVSADIAQLETRIAAARKDRIGQGAYSEDEEKGICRAEPYLFNGKSELTDELLERIRAMCQLWEIDIVPSKITSHRKFIGPFIVAFKKALFPLIRFCLKDMIRQQRDFNAATIRYVAELSSQQSSQQPSLQQPPVQPRSSSKES